MHAPRCFNSHPGERLPRRGSAPRAPARPLTQSAARLTPPQVLDDVYCSADEPIALLPSSGGNIHQFTALTDCAVLDLMSPPYCTEVRQLLGQRLALP